MKTEKWGLHWAFLFTLALVLAYFDIDRLLRAMYELHFSRSFLILIDVLLQFVCLFFAVLSICYFKACSLTEALWFVGFKRPKAKEIFLGILLGCPRAIFVFIEYMFSAHKGGFFSLTSDWFSQEVFMIFSAGIVEEAFFRGFIFQMLRKGRSFIEAAFWSSLLFALYHFTNWQFESDEALRHQMLYAFILGFSAAYVFEKCGNKIWPWMFTHILVDLSSEVRVSMDFVSGVVFELARVIITTLAAFPLTNWIISSGKPRPRKNFFDKPFFEKMSLFLIPVLFLFEICLLFPVFYSWNMWIDFYKYQKKIESNPKDFETYLRWGSELGEAGNYSEAVDKLKKTIELNNKSIYAYERLSMACFHLERYEESAKASEKVCSLAVDESTRETAYIYWGEALAESEGPQKAILKYKLALRLNPESVAAYEAWGETLLKFHFYPEAAEKFQKTLSIDNRNIFALTNLGMVYEELGRYEEAMGEWIMAIQMNPGNFVWKVYAGKKIADLCKKHPEIHFPVTILSSFL